MRTTDTTRTKRRLRTIAAGGAAAVALLGASAAPAAATTSSLDTRDATVSASDSAGLRFARCTTVRDAFGAKVPAAGIFATNVNCVLRWGYVNNLAVQQLQSTLNECHGAHLAEDGDFGDATRAALVAAQVNSGVFPADGVYGPQTRVRINHEASSGVGCARSH